MESYIGEADSEQGEYELGCRYRQYIRPVYTLLLFPDEVIREYER